MSEYKTNLVVSLSGGETSAFMLFRILFFPLIGYKSVHVVFANTSQENEETFIFIDKVSKLFNVKVTWIESVTYHNERKSSGYKIVDFDTAARDGSIFEDMINKYGIPNKAYPHCTRELKNEPIKKWCVDNFRSDYDIAIGIRLDELKRKPKTNTYKTVYPLIDQGLTKEDVIDFWSHQSFRLNIENYQGNCKWCWKKANTKLKIIAVENPEVFDFPARMELEKGLCGHNIDGNKRVFFRGNKSTKQIIEEAADPDFNHISERARIIKKYNEGIDEGGCSESCEAFVEM
jgi:3'-phosphoadenosine 5'-phosphosulfate sulfotransferase (PAPS reductase)/FAD synthetase